MRGTEYAELRAFAAIVEHGSFTRAAAHLGVTASTLSQTVRRVEERLGVRLLNRTTRSVAPTEAGQRLIRRLAPALQELEGAVLDAKQSAQRIAGVLRLNTSRVAAVTYLAPILGKFLLAYPDVRMDIVTEERLIDIVAERFDAGIRLGEKLHQDMIATRLSGDLVMKVVASPAYLARAGEPKRPQDLVHHRCLGYRRPSDGSLYRWEFERGDEKLEVVVDGPLMVDEPAMLTQVACAGAGIAYQFAHQVDNDIAQGRLVQLLPEWTPAFPGFYLYYPSRRQNSPAFALLVEALRWEGDDALLRKPQ